MSKIYDKKRADKISSKLKSLGLSDKEALLYMAMFGKSQSGATRLGEITGIHRQGVYDTMRSLEEKGLVKHVNVRGRMKFSANPPERLSMYVDQKKILASSLVSDLASFGLTQNAQDFEIYQGNEAFIAHEMDMLENGAEGESVDIICGKASGFNSLVEGTPLVSEIDGIRQRKKISIRMIASDEEIDFLEYLKKYDLFDYRVMPGMKVGTVNTVIRPTVVSFHTYGEPILAYTVKSERVVATYRNFFDSLWDMCSK